MQLDVALASLVFLLIAIVALVAPILEVFESNSIYSSDAEDVLVVFFYYSLVLLVSRRFGPEFLKSKITDYGF